MFNYARKQGLQSRRVAIAAAGAGALAWALWAWAPAHAATQTSGQPFDVQADLVRQIGGEVYTFYAARGYRPLWMDADGTPGPAAALLLELLQTSQVDGIDASALKLAGVTDAVEQARTTPTRAAISRAELALSNALVAYAQALNGQRATTMIYEHDNLRPRALGAYHLLQAAAGDASLEGYVRQMKWMHPLYAPLRRSLITTRPSDERTRQLVISNLARIRGIPLARRQIVVDIATARLWMYEDGRAVDSMRVVVGRETTRTPWLAGYLRYAIINPYWNVPTELVSRNIAPKVLQRGPAYLKAGGYEVLSDWSDNPVQVDPRKVDWNAAARGKHDLRIRQLPRPGNAMGKVKYEFPNQYGIYLHDTPDKNLMLKDQRQFSAGCIRLEDAERLGRWLMGGVTLPESQSPETRVDLPRPVPIYLTYLTAHVDEGRVAMGPDPYGIDAAA